MPRFVIVGQRATASPQFSLEDLAATSGRLDVLLRALRAALLVSHGVRRDVIAYLVLLGGPRAPVSIRFDGSTVKFLRPEERALATLVKKLLAMPIDGASFVEAKAGIAIARAGLDAVIADLGAGLRYVLDESAPDVRGVAIDANDGSFFVGDHVGFDASTRAAIDAAGAIAIGLGPVSLHAEDAVAVMANEIDRRR